MSERNAIIFDLYRGTSHDGPGLRTTIFFKGCPLRCAWCHNPEGIAPQPQIWWDARRCIGCLRCREACPSGALHAGETGIRIDAPLCRHCGACVRACPSKAQSYTGEEWSAERLLHEALKDEPYYKAFGGGVTASGGEPMAQHESVCTLFRQLKARSVHTALDTCGNVPWSSYETVLPWTDCVLYDLKVMDPERHRFFTGCTNERILDNLSRIAAYIRTERPNLQLWIRTPLIPGATDSEENLLQISQFIQKHLSGIIGRWELCAFNNICKSKYDKMHKVWMFADQPLLPQSRIDSVRRLLLHDGFPEALLVISGVIAAPESDTSLR